MITDNTHRFAFGKNWENFSETITKDKINESVGNLKRILGEENLDGKSFLDIGCGSGIHALAALKLGASNVTAFDIDQNSINTTRKVISESFPNNNAVIEVKNILNEICDDKDNKFDIVYSWGVLHHTGEMFNAIENAASFVKPNGKFVIAIYKKSPLCGFWRIEKSLYSRLPALLQFPITLIFSSLYLLGLCVKGKNPVKYIKSYRGYRGMNFWHDMIDWLGGYPYESATPDEIKIFVENKGFDLIDQYNISTVKAFGAFGCGCAEYVFKRK